MSTLNSSHTKTKEIRTPKSPIKILINDVEINVDDNDFNDSVVNVKENFTSLDSNIFKLTLKTKNTEEGNYWVHPGMKISLLKNIYSKRTKVPTPHINFCFYSSFLSREGIVVDIRDSDAIGNLGLGPGSTLWVYQY